MKSNNYLHWCMFTAAIVASGLFSAQGVVVYESATLGPPSSSGYVLSSYQYLGSRFFLNEPVQVEAIGGDLSVDGGSLFGAIVSLSSPSALPSGSPFDMTTVAAVAFTLPVFQDSDVTVPLSVELQPGNYALIFGSGQFGANGQGELPIGNADIPGQASYFYWYYDHWANDSVSNTRFVVYGEVVPEPSILALFTMASGGIALLKRRSRKDNHQSRIEKETESDYAPPKVAVANVGERLQFVEFYNPKPK